MFWNASARADINPDGINYPRLSDNEKRRLERIKDQEPLIYFRDGEKELRVDWGRDAYLGCAVVAVAVSIGVALGFNHFATKLIGPRNIAAALALSSGAGFVATNLRKAGLEKRESEFEGLGAKQAEKIFEPLNDHGYSVHDLETVLQKTFGLKELYRNDGNGQPYAVGFNKQANQEIGDIIGQFRLDFGDDSQIKRFVNLLRLSQKLSDECPEKLSALGECGELIKDPGFVQKLARYVSTGNTNGRREKIDLIVDSGYLPCIEEELYLLCRSALVTLAVMGKNEELHKTINRNYLEDDRRASSILYGVICSSARVCNGLASRLEQEIGLDIIAKMRESYFYGLSAEQVVAVTAWSEKNRFPDPLVEAIDRLSNPPPVIPAIDLPGERAR